MAAWWAFYLPALRILRLFAADSSPVSKVKTATRPQYHRLRRILEMLREGSRNGSFPNCGDFRRELEVSRRTIMRDLEFLRDDEKAPIAYDESRKGFRLTDATFALPPV